MQGAPIRHFRPEEKEIFGARWRVVEARFGEDPEGAVRDADALVTEAMRTRGYPPESFEERADDFSVDHPNVVHRYRAAHEVAVREDRGAGRGEDLKRAMADYRSVFEELLERQAVP